MPPRAPCSRLHHVPGLRELVLVTTMASWALCSAAGRVRGWMASDQPPSAAGSGVGQLLEMSWRTEYFSLYTTGMPRLGVSTLLMQLGSAAHCRAGLGGLGGAAWCWEQPCWLLTQQAACTADSSVHSAAAGAVRCQAVSGATTCGQPQAQRAAVACTAALPAARAQQHAGKAAAHHASLPLLRPHHGFALALVQVLQPGEAVAAAVALPSLPNPLRAQVCGRRGGGAQHWSSYDCSVAAKAPVCHLAAPCRCPRPPP